MTRTLAKVFQPVLDLGAAGDIETVGRLADQWRAVCDEWYDPRHPFHRFERCLQVATRICQVENLLMRAPLERGDVWDVQQRKEFHEELAVARTMLEYEINLGVPEFGQLVRAIKLYAIARPLAGDRSQRARTLDELLRIVEERLPARTDDESEADYEDRISAVSVDEVARWIRQAERAARQQARVAL
jgi:hypothetical protein